MNSNIKILLIDDNPGDAKLIKTMLQEAVTGDFFNTLFELRYSEKLSTGLKYINECEIDVILLDLYLQESQGMETFYKTQEKASMLPIIVLTGLDDEKLALQALHEGAQDYLVKGELDNNLLVRSIRYAIERKKVEEDKEKMNEILLQAQKMDAIGTLAGGIAHDFNNLMTAIQGFTDLLMLKMSEDDSSYGALKKIRIAANNAANLTNQMLLFSRKLPVKYKPLNLNYTINDLLKMIQRLVGEDIDVYIELEPKLWMIQGDRGTIDQMIINLTVNTKDAMSKGGKFTIKTKNVILNDSDCENIPEIKRGKFVLLIVSDTGIGMDKETLEHIFEPYYSTRGLGKATGLGLSVVYGIVKQHGGYIDVNSELEHGSTFKIYLPAFSLNKKGNTSKGKSIRKKLNEREKRILLVEDADVVRDYIALALNENGYNVHAVSNATDALNLFKKEGGDFDLLFSDIVLPDMNGIDLIDQLLSIKSNLRVLLSSGYSDRKLQWSMIQERGFRFLKKPYAFKDLLNEVGNALK
jgi:signal transduction histidine kinase